MPSPEDRNVFDPDIERLFARAPVLPDNDAFVSRLQDRLRLGEQLRRWMLGLAGLVGGLVAVRQLLAASLALQFQETSTHAVQVLDGWAVTTSARIAASLDGAGMAGMGWFWIASAVVVTAIVGAMRLSDQA